MGKIKNIIISLLVSLLLGVSSGARPVLAISPQVSISELGEYVNTNSFDLSYSALSDDPGAITAQFFFREESGSYAAFGPALIGASGQVEVTSSQLNDQAEYFFKVEINGGAASDETSTIYDSTSPGTVQNYWKEKLAPGFYKLHWKNPSDADSHRVFIYRSDQTSFTADASHKVGEVGGTPNSEMTWDNTTPDSGTEYYYALRVVDKAGNSSGLVTDAPGTVTTSSVLGTSTQASFGGSTQVSKLPEEEVLSEEAETNVTSSPTPEPTRRVLIPTQVLEKIAGDGKGGLIAAIIGAILLLASGYYFLLRRKDNS